MTDASRSHPTQGLRWQGDTGDRWNEYHEQFEGMLAPVGDALLDAAAFRPGESVIDVGCGAGGSTLDIARRVGPAGRVTGLDISGALLETAKRRAREAGLANVDFIRGDAAVVTVEAPHDCLFSRFGLMFFEDPFAAFANMRRFLKPGGRIIFACWGPAEENAWVKDTLGVVARYKTLPPPVPRAPGPLAFAEPGYTREILEKAGFAGVAFSEWRGVQLVGGPGSSAFEASRFLMKAGFVGEAASDLPDGIKDRVKADLVTLLQKFSGPRGIEAPSMAWFVSARA